MLLVRVRCWPSGRVVPAVDLEFACPPLVGDAIEIADAVAVVVSRRFAPDGSLHVRCDPAGEGEGFDEIVRAFDERR